ncbi:hypothetical protein K449DRAFT_467298, partial [Hypoxylon sp. EC38]
MEPLSFTASVAGLISLGLTVSSGIIGYCKAYRSQDADLVQLVQHTQELESFLGSVRNRTTTSQTPNTDIENLFQGCRKACDACLSDFKRLNARYTTLTPNRNFKERSQKIIQKFKYPFDKGKLDDLRSQLQGFNTRLLGFLQLVNLDATRDIRSLIISESNKVELAVESMGREIQSSLADVQQTVTNTIHVGVDELESSLQRSVEDVQRNTMIYLDQCFKLQTRALLQALPAGFGVDGQAASFESNAANGYWDQQGVPEKKNLRTPIRNIFDSLCTCTRIRQRRSTEQHQQSCVYFSGNRKTRKSTISVRVFRRQITAIFEIEYSRMAWAHVKPNLTVRATVPNDSPAFMAVEKIEDDVCLITTSKELEELFRGFLIKLKQIFTNGRGWPTDVNDFGDNLLHLVLRTLPPRLSHIISDETANIFMQFIMALKQIGVRMDDTSSDNSPPLAALLIGTSLLGRKSRFTHSTFMVNKFLEFMETEPTLSLGHAILITTSMLQLRNLAVYEFLDCNELIYAILHHSELDVVRLLMRNPLLIYDRDRSGHTPLHFAVNWPKGLSLLIQYGGESIRSIINYDRCLGYTCTALEDALQMAEIKSVKLLLEAGASIRPNNFDEIKWASRFEGVGQAEQMTCIVVESLVQQRRDLLQLALQHLPAEDIVELRLEKDELLDEKAFIVAEALRRQHIPIPTTYDFLRPGSVYHWPYLDSSIVRKLYAAGFREIDANLCGRTPLTILVVQYGYFKTWLEIVDYFKGHGADLYAPVPMPNNLLDSNCSSEADTTPKVDEPKSALTIYFMMINLARIVKRWTREKVHRSRKPQFNKMDFTAAQPISSTLFGDRTTDSCICYCTTDGCIPSSKYLQPALSVEFKGKYRDIVYPYAYVFDAILLAEPVIPTSLKYTVSLEYIRQITFARLGMKHTCCRFEEDYQKDLEVCLGQVHFLDPTEIEEIREEDRYLAEQLEVLMKEFEEKFREMDMPLTQFVEKYLWPRLDEIEKERVELTAEESRVLRETGVVLHEH